MSPRLKTVLALVGSAVLGGGLLWLALRGVEVEAVAEALRTADYRWLGPLVAVTLTSIVLRAWRWRMLLGTLPAEDGGKGPAISLRMAFYSVMIGYMVNYAAPRLGEFARAGNMAARTGLRFTAIFGTVVAERVLDVLSLLVALGSVALLFRDRLRGVLGLFAANGRATLDALPLAALAVGAGVFLLLLLVAGIVWRRRAARQPNGTGAGKLAGLASAFRDGLASVFRAKPRAGVLATTLGIWACYLLMADIPLRMLGLSERYGLGLVDAWALMNVGAIGMSLPSPGGTGSFHYVTVQTLVHLLGVDRAPAATYALLTHAAQLVFLCAGGFVCLLLQGTSVRALRQTTADARADAASSADVPRPHPLPSPREATARA